jgi:membrane fusion protein (multidrug efflux system)
MAAFSPSRPRTGLLVRLRRRARAAVPGFVWLATVVLVAWLGQLLPGPGRVVGYVDAEQCLVTTPVDGRLAALLVDLHDQVTAGQVVARLDDTDLRQRLASARHLLDGLRADLQREVAELEHDARLCTAEHDLDAAVEQRRLISSLETAQLDALRVRAELAETRVRLQGVTVETERLTALVDKEMISDTEPLRARTEQAALQKRTAELESLLAEHQVRVEASSRRLREFAPDAPPSAPIDAALAPLRAQVRAQEAEVERLVAEGRRLDLQAPIAGTVTSLAAIAGEWAVAGRVLCAISAPAPRRILAYVPDTLRQRLQDKRSVRVLRQDTSLLGTVPIQSISPAAVRMPERLWADPRQEEWAFELVLAATGTELPGERVQLVLP